MFADVLARLVTWYTGHGLDPQRAAFVTCGQWDLVTMLPAKCRHSGGWVLVDKSVRGWPELTLKGWAGFNFIGGGLN